jgi:hypothetical protein
MTNPTGTRYPRQNPIGTGTGMSFYPQVRVQISTCNLFAGGRVIALPDPNPTCCHPYSDKRTINAKKHRWWVPWEAVSKIREHAPSTLRNIDGGPSERRC